MKKFLSVTAGAPPEDARTIFLSDDPDLINLVVACLVARIEMGARPGVPQAAFASAN